MIKNTNVLEMLKAVQKRCSVRTLSLDKIERILQTVEKNLSVLDHNAIYVHYDGGEYFPRAYNGIPMSTHFKAHFDGDVWEIDSITREKCPNRKTWNTTVYNTQDLIIDRFLIY